MSEQTSTETVSAEAVRRSLDGCLRAPAFRRSPKLATFLGYIVEEELAGRGEAIKAYTIATQALRRSSSFDPSNDPSVRVEAGRLRRVLDEVYADEGRNLPVRILVPVGGYRPSFEVQPAGEAGWAAMPKSDPRPASLPNVSPSPLPSPLPSPPPSSLSDLPSDARPARDPIPAARHHQVMALFESPGQAVLAGLLAVIAFLLAVEIILQIYMLTHA